MSLQGVGTLVGEYFGDGKGEAEELEAVDLNDVPDVDANLEVDLSNEEGEDSSDHANPLLFLYDCETTGLSIYSDHIIEIAAEVLDCPVNCSNTTYNSLVKTSRRIPAAGTEME